MKKKIYISAPLEKQSLENHLKRFLRYARFTFESKAVPVAVHFYVLCFDDEARKTLHLSLEERFSLIWYCDEMWVFGPVVTKDMEREIEFCENMNMKVLYITEKEVKKRLGDKEK